MARLFAVAALMFVLTACTFQRAMLKGNRLANAGDWAGAYDAYARAAEQKPEHEEAAASLERARERVVVAALEEARQALDASDYETADDRLSYAEKFDSDRPELYELRARVQDAIRDALIRNWESGDARATYALAVRARKLFPKADYLAPTFEQLRGHFTRAAESLLRDQRYDVSLAAARTITEFEPDRAEEVAPLERRILEAWADDLVRKAARHLRAKQLGAAAASYAHAYELAGRDADLAKARELAAQLAQRSKLSLKLDVTGIPWRADALRTALGAGIVAIPDTGSAATPAAAGLQIRVAAGAPKCTETDAVTPASVDYVSGQVEKPNPEHVQLGEQLSRAVAEEKGATASAEALWSRLKAAEGTLSRFDRALEAAQRLHTEAEAAYDQAASQLKEAKEKRDELDASIDAAEASGSPKETVRAMEDQLGQLGLRVSEWSGELLEREEAEGKARRELARATAEREPPAEAYAALKTEHDGLTAQRDAARQRVGELSAKMSSTPRTVMEDVHATFDYEIHDWTRRCTAPVDASAIARWSTSLPKSRRLEPALETTDRAHPGHPKAGVQADRKEYPVSDADLIARSDAESARELLGWATSLADDYYASRISAALGLAPTDPLGASSEMISLYVAARGRLDESAQTAFGAHLKEHFGLEQIAFLLPAP